MSDKELAFLIIGLVLGLASIPLTLGLSRIFGLHAIVEECETHVYTLFGKVLGTFEEAGLFFPIARFGPRAMLVPFFGKRHVVSTTLRQHYLRRQMVNSEEGTPMGVGIWYEMQISNPEAYLFRNTNPEGSLLANVASSTVSVLSNLEMEQMLEDRHSLSRTVRGSVSPQSEKWGYRLGSVYIRKVEFTDPGMVVNITDKVIKRLVQVTSAMKQDGENRVGLILSETANKVSQQMAEASTTRPAVVGQALNSIGAKDPEILDAMMDVIEVEKLVESGAPVEWLPSGAQLLFQLGDSGQAQVQSPENAY